MKRRPAEVPNRYDPRFPWARLALTCLVFALSAGSLEARAPGGLRLTGRGLVAVPQKDYGVFVTWRSLVQDGAEGSFDVYRGASPTGPFTKVGTAGATTTFRDKPGPGAFWYHVVPLSGALKGVRSNGFKVTTGTGGRDWVEVYPGTKGRRVQLGNAHFADTDGDGELEFVTHNPRSNGFWPTPLTSGTFKVEVYEMYDGTGPRWAFDTKCGPSGTPYNHHTQFHPVAHDINGDFKAEIITMTSSGKYTVLADEGTGYRVVGTISGGGWYNAFADLGGKYYAFLDIHKNASAWEYDGKGAFVRKWQSTGPSAGDSHSQLVFDMDGDGRDEFGNCTFVWDDDGSLLWDGSGAFGGSGMGSVMEVSDADPRNPGYEMLMTIENASLSKPAHFALFDAKTGRNLWARKARVCGDIQVAFFADVNGGPGLDIVGTDCGHHPKAGIGFTYSGTVFDWPFDPIYPMISFDLGSMDWLGERGYDTRILNRYVYGRGGEKVYTADLSDCVGCSVPQAPGNSDDRDDWLNDKVILRYWNNIDLVGDHREDLVFGMPDGSIRVYINTQTPPSRKVAKFQYRSYEIFQAISSRQGFAKALGQPDDNSGTVKAAPPVPGVDTRRLDNRHRETAPAWDLRGRSVRPSSRSFANGGLVLVASEPCAAERNNGGGSGSVAFAALRLTLSGHRHRPAGTSGARAFD